MVGKTGVSPKEHQDLARHSTYALTGRYTHSHLYDLAAAVNGLPSIVASGGDHQTLAATGTDGKFLGPFLGPQPAISMDFVRQTETNDAGRPQTKNPGKQAVIAVLQGKGQCNSEVEPRGIEPLTSALRTRRSPS